MATGWSSAPVMVGMDAGASPALFDTVSVLIGATGIALGTVAVRRRRKGDEEEAASRPTLDERVRSVNCLLAGGDNLGGFSSGLNRFGNA